MESPTPLSTPSSATEAGRALFAGSLVPQRVAHQFGFTEGPAVDQQGNVFFTDQPNDTIWKYSTDGELSIFLHPAGRPCGLYFDEQGNLIACAAAHNQLWSITPDGAIQVLVAEIAGQRLNGPNDVWVRPTGGLYFTDPYYNIGDWQVPRPSPIGQYVYYLAAGSAQPLAVETTLRKPNGLVGTADGRILYVADTEGNQTYRYLMEPDGELIDKQLFVEQGSDGITMDEDSNVYLTGKGITIYNPAGHRLAYLDVPTDWTSNLCFGGPDRRTLFVTAGPAVFTVPMRVRGIH